MFKAKLGRGGVATRMPAGAGFRYTFTLPAGELILPTDAHPHQHASADAARQGSRQPQRFDPARAARLDDPARFAYLPPGDLLQLLAAPHGARVLDFGAGTGLYALALALARPDLRILALDEQPEMLELLRAKLAAPAAPPNVQSLAPSDLPALRGQL